MENTDSNATQKCNDLYEEDQDDTNEAGDDDLRPEWPNGGMVCPVTGCGTKFYIDQTTYWGHWKRKHLEQLRQLYCPKCPHKSLNKRYFATHLTKKHKIKMSDLDQVIANAHTELIPNKEFIPPGTQRCPKRKSVSSESQMAPKRQRMKSPSQDSQCKHDEDNSSMTVAETAVKAFICNVAKEVSSDNGIERLPIPISETGQKERSDKNVSHGTSRNDNIPHSHHTKKATVFPPTEVQNFSVSDAESEKWTSDSSVITEMEKEKSKGVQLPDKGWHEGGMRCHVPACGSKEFDTFNSYQAHWKQIHSDTIKEFKCPLCSFKHSEKLQLQRHLRLKHKVDKTALQAMLSIMKVEVSPNEQYIDPGTVEFPKGKVHDFSGSEGKTKRPRLSAAQVLEIKQGSGGEKKSTKQTDFSDPAAASILGSDLGIQSDNRRHVDDFGFEDKRILQVRLKADMAATISKEENVSNDIVKQVAVLERKETEINESVNMVTESYVDIKRDDADVDKATVEGDNSIDTQVLECVTKLKESVVEMKKKVIIESEKTIDTQVSESFTNVTESAIQMEIKFADVDKGTIEMEKAIDTQVLECAPKITECAVQTADVDKGTIEMDKAIETWVFECAPKITEYAVQIADVDKGTIEMDKAIDTQVLECVPKIKECAIQTADVDKGTIEMDKAIDTQVLECVPKIKECGIQTTDVDKGTIEMDKAIDTQVLECVPKITECAIQTADVDKGTIEMDKETQVSVCVGTSDIQRNVDSKKVSKAARKIETVTDSASNFYITSDRIRKEADKSINEIPETSCLRIRQREDEDKINPPVETETVNDKERHEIYISYDTVIRKGDDKREYNYKDQSECDIKDQGECDIKDQGECDIKDQGECDIKDQGECDIKDQGECDIKDQGECDIKDQSECDIKDQGECDIKDQGECDIKDQSECDIKDQSDYDESDQDLSVTDDSELDEAKEAEDLDTVVRPIFLDGQMLCPGSGCFNLDQVYGSLKAFYKHWQDEHRSSVQRFECPCCSFKDVRKLEIRRHLKTEHHTRHRGVLEELMSLVKLEGTPKTAEDSKSETISKRKSASQLKTKIKKQKILLVSDAHETKDGKDTKDKSPKDEGANKAQIQCVSESNEKLLPKKEKVVWFFGMSCPVKNCCTRKFMSPREFHNHWENVHNPYIKKFECHICQYQNTQREVVGNHLRLSHNAVNTNDVRDLSQIKMVNVGNPMYKDPGMFYFGNVPIENQDVKATSTMSPVQAGTDGIPELKKTEDTGTQAKKENMKISKDIVPVHWVSGLTCPVMNCGASHFMTFLSFQNHWENIHNKNIFKFKCPKCTFTNISKPNIISHLSVKHKMSNAKIEFKTKYIQNVITKNNRYIDPGCYSFSAMEQFRTDQPNTSSLSEKKEKDETTALTKVNVVKVLNPEFKDTEGYYFESPGTEKEAECSPSKSENQSSEQASNEMDLGGDLERKIEKTRKVTWKKDMCCPVKACGSDTYLTLDSFSNHWIKTHHLEFSMFQCSRCVFMAIQKSEIENHLKSHHCILAEKDETTALTKVNIVKVLNPEFKDTEGYYFESPGTEKEAECSPSKSENKSSEQASNEMDLGGDLERKIEKTRKVTLKKDMCCPVKACGSETYLTLDSFSNHWIKTHHLEFSMFQCSLCTFKTNEKSDILNHLKSHHCILAEKDETTALTKVNVVKVLNPEFKDTEGYYFESPGTEKEAECSPSKSENQSSEQASNEMDLGGDLERKIEKTRKVTLKKDMCCPVKACGSDTYLTLDSFSNHWIKTHHLEFSMFQCSRCVFMAIQKSEIENHLKSHHWILAETDLMTALSKVNVVKVLNPEFKDTEGYYFECPCIEQEAECSPSKYEKKSSEQASNEMDLGVDLKMKIEKTRKVTWKKDMCCPVKACGSETYLTLDSFSNHWIKTHHLEFSMFQCSRCTFKAIQKSEIENHLKSHHWILAEKDVTTALTKVNVVKVLNPEFKDTEGYYFESPGIEKEEKEAECSPSKSENKSSEQASDVTLGTCEASVNSMKHSLSQNQELRSVIAKSAAGNKEPIEVVFVSNMRCPVDKCGTQGFKKWFQFKNHWKEKHLPFQEHFLCKICNSWKAAQKCKYWLLKDVYLHLENVHGIKYHTIEQDIIIEHNTNFHFIDPGPLYFRMLARNADGSKSASSIQKKEEKESMSISEEGMPKIVVEWKNNMTCPVHKCFVKIYDSWTTYCKHWKMVHEQRYLKLCACPKCLFRSGQRSNVVKHMKQGHNLKERELDRVAEEIKFVDIENPTFIDPGNYTFNLFAKRNGKKTPSTTASSEISKSVTLGTCEASVKSMKHSLSQNQELRSVTAKSASGNEEPIEVVFVSNMRCPVDKCGTEGFRKWFHFNKHWKENHLPFQEHFLCKICNSRKTVQNYKYWLLKDIYLHLENVHGIKYHTIEQDIIIEHNTNFHFINPGPLYFKKVARNTDASKSASSIQKKEEKESTSISEEGMPKIVVEWKYNMTCPVHKCFVKIYDSWTTYCKHWKMVHEQRYLKLCACPKCPFQSGQRSNVVKHMKQCHNLKRRELDKAAEEIKFVDIENPTFIDPGNYTCNLFAKRNGKKPPSTTASSEISKSEATLPKKGTEPTDEEERYPKKFIFAPGMPCPVKNCSSVQISSYTAFVHHWNEQHALMLKKFACTKCDFKHIQKSIVFVHVRKEHGMPSHLITQKIKTVEETSVKAEELYVPDLPTVHRSIIMVKTDDSGQFNTYDINGGKIKEATAVVEEMKKSDENIGKLSEQKDESRDGSDQEESREQKHEDTCTGLRDEKKALVVTQPADVDRENVLTNNTTQMVDKSSDSDTKLRISASENQEEKDASSQKKSTEPAGKEQRFSNKLIFKPRMPCPVKNCSSVPIKSYTVFVHHWNEQHALMLKKFACTMCDFKHIQKSIVFMHVRKEHGMPSHGITQKITTVMETNNNYVDVDELYFPEFPTEDMKLLIMVKPDDSETGAFEEVLSGSSAEQQSVTVQTEVKQLVFNNDVEDTIEKEKCYVKGKNEFSKEDVKSVVPSDSSDVPQIVVDDDVLISDFEEDSVTVDMSEFICLDEIGDEDAETSEMSPEKPSVKETELPDDQDKFSPPTEDDQMDDILNHFICIDDIGDEKDDIGDENDDIGNEKDNIGDEKDDIGDEKDDIGDEKDDIGDENDDIGNEKDNIGDEKDNIGDENYIGNEKDNTGNEKDNIGDEKDDIGDENDDIGNEKDNIGDEKDNIGDENDDIGDEKDNIGDENDEIGNEKENIGNEKDNTLDENDDIENEKDNTGNEKDNIGDENDDIGNEKENTGNEKDNIGNEKDNIEDENDDIGNEKENNGNEKDNIGDEEMN